MWLTGLFAPRHVGSSQTRARTRVPCIGRQILNHCATREAPSSRFYVAPPTNSQADSYYPCPADTKPRLRSRCLRWERRRWWPREGRVQDTVDIIAKMQEWAAASLTPFLGPPSDSLSLTSLPLTQRGALSPLPSLGATRG